MARRGRLTLAEVLNTLSVENFIQAVHPSTASLRRRRRTAMGSRARWVLRKNSRAESGSTSARSPRLWARFSVFKRSRLSRQTRLCPGLCRPAVHFFFYYDYHTDCRSRTPLQHCLSECQHCAVLAAGGPYLSHTLQLCSLLQRTAKKLAIRLEPIADGSLGKPRHRKISRHPSADLRQPASRS